MAIQMLLSKMPLVKCLFDSLDRRAALAMTATPVIALNKANVESGVHYQYLLVDPGERREVQRTEDGLKGRQRARAERGEFMMVLSFYAYPCYTHNV